MVLSLFLMDRPVSVPALFAWFERSEAVSKESEEDAKEKSLRLTVPRLARLRLGRKAAALKKEKKSLLSK